MNTSRFRPHRPLLGGIAIYNPNAMNQGTLGFVAMDDANERWIVSCYHVLCRFQGLFPNGASENVFQPSFSYPAGNPLNPVAVVTNQRIDPLLDIAAARVINGEAVGRIYGVGKLGNVTAQSPINRRVIKSGIQTEITEGIVSAVSAQEIQIARIQDHTLSEPGDSGSLWLDAETLAPVAMHTGMLNSQTATARPIQLVLSTLNLRFAPFAF